MPNTKEKVEPKFEKHAEVMESVRKLVNMIGQENIFSAVEMLKEDLHDGKVTFRFSFTPAK